MKISQNFYLLSALALACVLVLYFRQPELLEGFEARTYDLRARSLRTLVAPSPNIAIIAFDDKSIAELGRFPWPREQFAALLKVTSQSKAKAVLFDVIFSEEQAASDRNFAAAIRYAGNATLTEAFELSADGSPTAVKNNVPILQKAAAHVAHMNIFPDEDGVLRWTRPVIFHQGKLHPSLGLRGAAELLGGAITAGEGEIVVGSRRIPLDDQKMLINYSGSEGKYQRFSFVDVLRGRVPQDQLHGRLLFVGATALALYDMRITPVSNNMPGVEVNANIADAIVRGDFMRRGTQEALADMAFIIFLGMITTAITMKVRHSASLPLVILLAAGYVAFTCRLFVAGHWLSIVYPLLGVVLSFALAAYLRFFCLDRRARDIRSMFSCYVSRKVVDELVRNPDLAKVGGETRELTILFADVKNFTSYSEKRSPAEVVRILNEFLAEMTNVILKYDGNLDKFLGDGILAFWNAPLRQDNHAELAVRCACEMMQRMEPLQQRWLQRGDEPFAWGIGVNTGEVIVGTIGAQGKKMEYTAIGDNVNLTYRIQNESRENGYPVITRSLYERVAELVEVEPLGQVIVRGKQVPIDIYALHGMRQGAE